MVMDHRCGTSNLCEIFVESAGVVGILLDQMPRLLVRNLKCAACIAFSVFAEQLKVLVHDRIDMNETHHGNLAALLSCHNDAVGRALSRSLHFKGLVNLCSARI